VFEIVLVPIDQTRATVESASKILELAQKNGSHLILLSVVLPDFHKPSNNALDSSFFDFSCEKIKKAGLLCNFLIRQGKPAFVICEVADEMNVDLIVMGTRGVHFEEENGSTAARVIELAPCPVLVVP